MVLADEPKITDWLSVWFSLGSGGIALLALIAATIAVRATIETNRNQSEQLRRLEETQEQEAASRFAVWLEGDSAKKILTLTYHNGSSLPVYDVAVTLNSDYPDSGWTAAFPPLPSTTSPAALKNSNSKGDVGKALALLLAAERDEEGKVRLFELLQNVRLHVKFRDGNGIRWATQPNGKLDRVTHTEATSQPSEQGTQLPEE